MNNITSDSKLFWQDNPNAMKVLYGAGINADIIIKMANKAGFKIDCILDIKAEKSGHLYNDIPIYSSAYFKENIQKQNLETQIFISIDDVFGAISHINAYLNNVNIIIPPCEKGVPCHNFAIAPLRKNLLKDKNITFIGNSCIAARMYQVLDLPFFSPTIATIIEPEDYLKLCLNFKEYMSKELEFYNHQEWFVEGYYHVTCKLGDVKIRFMGQTDYEYVKKNWDKRVKRVNYENLVFLWDYNHYPATTDMLKQFGKIKNKKLILFPEKNSYVSSENSITNIHFYSPNVLIEKKLLLTDWLNSVEDYA